MGFAVADDQEFVLPPLEERPLVTFALFAYNQEEYIREAVEGALSQTYEPLEIILSDDCSTDRTFEIMKEMAATYQGVHCVSIRRNPLNLGVLRHLIRVAREARGDFMVLSAGDDISQPTRSSRLVGMWLKGFDGVYSNFDLIDRESKLIATNRSPLGTASSRLPWLKNVACDHFVYGATSSYAKEIIDSLIEPDLIIQSEDTPTNTVLHSKGRNVGYIPESLVAYRIHDASLSTSRQVPARLDLIVDYEINEQRKAKRQYELMVYMRELLATLQVSKSPSVLIDLKPVEDAIEFAFIKSNWRRFSLSEKLKKIFSTRSFIVLKWTLSRLAGLWIYGVIKLVNRKIFRNSYSEVK